MRPAREINVVLRARDKQVCSLQDHNDFLKAQLDAYERRLTNARANAHADARAYQLQERKIEQLRMKLRDVRAASGAQRQELKDVRRESEMQREQLAAAQEENIRHLARIAELEGALQAKSSPTPTSDAEDLEVEGVSCDDILDVLAQVTIDLEVAAKMTEEIFSSDQLPDSIPRTAHANRVEMGIQTVSGDVSGANQSGEFRRPQGAEDMERPVLQTRASEGDQRRIRELEADLKNTRGLNEELRNAAEVARQDRQTIKDLEMSADEYRSEIESLEAQVVLYRTLLEESRAFSDDLEESHNSIVACKDAFIEELREKVKELTTSEAWSQLREASLHDAQDKLAAADIEILELRLELEGAQRNAVMSTNRIIHLEAEASAARHRLQTTDVENGDLREELSVASERVYALEDELVAAQGRLDNAESTIRQLRLEVERYVQTLARIPNSPRIQDDIHDVNDTDSASDEGSIDTLVMDPDEHSQLHPLSKIKDVDSPSSANQDKQFSHDLAPTSARDLEVRLEAMTLKYEAAEAARICGEDVEDMLRTKLHALSRVNLCPEKQFSSSTAFPPTKSDPDVRPDSPPEEWHSLPTIPEEDERSTSPTPQRAALPRIQTSCIVAAKNAVSVPVTAESPLLPSPTLSDIWFSDIRVSLALVENESSVLDWDLPSPGVDSDSS
jgi:predicted  nucleic acid-binding Zn-ribbon protein